MIHVTMTSCTLVGMYLQVHMVSQPTTLKEVNLISSSYKRSHVSGLNLIYALPCGEY
jgi:hypothetical protein